MNVLLDYKKGGLTLDQAVDRFGKLTGLTPDVAEKFIRGLGRDNVVSLSAKKSIFESKSAAE
tara:strand:+ start:341 stop:526 length:186 start_codon:yes stop_codon:yes gene_type:complete